MYLAYKKIKQRHEKKQQSQQQPPSSDSHASQDESLSAPEVPKSQSKEANLSSEDAAEKRSRTIRRWKLILVLASPFLLQSLDTTIIASAQPYIAEDFGQLSQLNWIVSAFNLTSAASLFLWSQLLDLFGRHDTLQWAIFIMLAGSAICTGTPQSQFDVLLLGRALQGIGAAGVNISVRTVLADGVSLEDYAFNWTIFALISGVGFSTGPVIGGYLTQASWRWCFAINLPVGVVAMALVFLLLRKDLKGPQSLAGLEDQDALSRPRRFARRALTIDAGGQMLFLWGFGLLILALTWAGGNYGWSSPHVLAPLIIGGVLSVAWVFYERSMVPGSVMARVFTRQRAMIPWELLTQPDIGLLFLINLTLGMSMFAIMYFMDYYFARVENRSSGNSGTSLLYFLPGLGAGVYMAIFASNYWPRQTIPPLLLGSIAASVGVTVLPWAIEKQQTSVIYGMMAVVGLGVGIRMNPSSLHGLAFFPDKTSQISCLVTFAIPFGGLIGLTIMSTVFNNRSGPDHLDSKSGVKWAFVAMIPFMWLSLVLTTLLGNAWILKDAGHEVVRGPYLWRLVAGKRLQKELKVFEKDQSTMIPKTTEEGMEVA